MDAAGPSKERQAGRSRDLLHVGDEPPRSLLVAPPPVPHRPDFHVVPPSALLGRLSAFVPQLAAANAELASALSTRPASDFDVEAVGEGGAHIQMDLSCGVLDLRDEAAQQAAQLAMAHQPLTEHILSTGDASSDSSSDDEDEDGHDTEVAGGGSGGPPPREQRRRRIEEL